MNKFRLIAVIVTVALAFGAVQTAAAVIPAPARQAMPQSTDGAITSYLGEGGRVQTAAELQTFWTQARLDEAQPVPDWVFERMTEREAAPETEYVANGPAMTSAPVLPGGAGAAAPVNYQAPGGSTASPNFSYPFPYTTGLIDPAFHGFYPWRVNGKLFFTNSAYGGGTFVCSATVVTSGATASGNENLLLTAGHCVNSGTGVWSQNVVFSPGRRSFINPQGLWYYSNEWALTNWTNYMNDRQDYAFIDVNGNGYGCGGIQTCYGAQGVAWNQYAFRDYWATGYPAVAPYNGEQMILCTSQLGKRDTNIPGVGPYPQGEYPMAIGCPMTGGASGGSWVIRGNNSNGGFANSVNSYKYIVPAQPNAIYGPYFDSNFFELWDAARQDFF